MRTYFGCWTSILLAASPAASALDKACEPVVAAAEKTTAQAARHSVAELDDGTRMEAIVVDGAFYASIGGTWRQMKIDLRAAERKLNAGMRSGEIPLSDCKDLGTQSVDGIATIVIGYRIALFGQPPAASRIHIGEDGLVYAIAADSQKVRYRYTGIAAPGI